MSTNPWFCMSERQMTQDLLNNVEKSDLIRFYLGNQQQKKCSYSSNRAVYATIKN